MASSAHSSYPLRPGLGKGTDRPFTSAFGASTAQQQRDNQRLERERERLEKERIEREEQNQLTEEQRAEIQEAVGTLLAPHLDIQTRYYGLITNTDLISGSSLACLILTKIIASITMSSKLL